MPLTSALDNRPPPTNHPLGRPQPEKTSIHMCMQKPASQKKNQYVLARSAQKVTTCWSTSAISSAVHDVQWKSRLHSAPGEPSGRLNEYTTSNARTSGHHYVYGQTTPLIQQAMQWSLYGLTWLERRYTSNCWHKWQAPSRWLGAVWYVCFTRMRKLDNKQLSAPICFEIYIVGKHPCQLRQP